MLFFYYVMLLAVAVCNLPFMVIELALYNIYLYIFAYKKQAYGKMIYELKHIQGELFRYLLNLQKISADSLIRKYHKLRHYTLIIFTG
jgi:hypothetical protein